MEPGSPTCVCNSCKQGKYTCCDFAAFQTCEYCKNLMQEGSRLMAEVRDLTWKLQKSERLADRARQQTLGYQAMHKQLLKEIERMREPTVPIEPLI